MRDVTTIDGALAGLDQNERYVRLKKLWFNVLWQALDDVSNPKYRRLALYWFNSNATAPGSFLWVCDILHIDAWHMRLNCGRRDVLKQAKIAISEENRRMTEDRRKAKREVS